MLSKHWLITLPPPKKHVKSLLSLNFPKFQLQKSIFFKVGKTYPCSIINEYKAVWGNLEIPFLSWVSFNNVFSHEKKNGVKFCLKWDTSKTKHKYKKPWYCLSLRPLIFKLQKFVLNSMISAWVRALQELTGRRIF